MNKLIPLFDHLYIFQQFEYEPLKFLGWFFNHFFERDLQRKHKLILTPKALILLVITLVLEVAESFYLSKILFGNFSYTLVFFLILQFIGPIYLVIAWLLFLPFETYQKQKIVNLAKEKLKSLPNIQVVAITGSFAKTSTKDILYTLLWKDFRVVKTPKSFNTEVSVARSVLSDLKDNTEIFIVEMDAYHPGEIKKLAQMVNPDIGVITAIAPQHLERFGSMEALAKTQFELAEVLPSDGLLVLNSSNEWTMKLERDYQLNKCFFGERDDDLSAARQVNFQTSNVKQTKNGLSFKLQTPLGFTQISLPLFGKHHIQNFLAAVAVSQNLGLTLRQISQRAKFILSTPHRLEIKQSGGVTIIDNTYNTNPIASQASLEVLREYPGNHKILITPGLVELGQEHFRGNKEFAKLSAKVANQIIIVGSHAKKALLAGLKEENYPKEKIITVKTITEALSLLPNLTKPETVVLLENDLPDQYN